MSFLERIANFGAAGGTRIAGAWQEFLEEMRAKPPLASTSFRFLARKIGEDFPAVEQGRALNICSLAKPDVANDSVLMLAWSLNEELKAKVVIIDLNLKIEGLSGRYLDPDARTRGISDVLAGRCLPADLPFTALSSGISLISVGASLTEVNALSIDKIAQETSSIFSHLRKNYDYILVQLGDVSKDTRVLAFARSGDLFLLLAEEGGSRMSAVEESAEILREHGVENVQLLLATAPRSISAAQKAES